MIKYLTVFVFLCTISVFSSTEVAVISDKAIIYADEKCTSPIGFLELGKKIKVGDVPRNRGRARTLVINKKIVFIRAIDVQPVSDLSTNHAKRFELARFNEIKNEKKNNYYGVSLVSGNLKFQSLPNYIVTNTFQFTTLGLDFQGDISENLGLFLHAEYIRAQNEDDTFKFVDIQLAIPYYFINQSEFTLNLGPVLSGIPYSQYSYQSKFRTNSGGFGGGIQTGAAVKIGNSLKLSLAYQYVYQKLGTFNTPKDAGFDSFTPTLTKTSLLASLLYRF